MTQRTLEAQSEITYPYKEGEDSGCACNCPSFDKLRMNGWGDFQGLGQSIRQCLGLRPPQNIPLRRLPAGLLLLFLQPKRGRFR